MKNFYISLGILIIFIRNCYLNVIISKSNNINSVVSFDCTSGSNNVKNTIPFSDCRSDVTIAVDSSSDLLLPMLFNDYELSLIKNNITADWENFSNVSLVWYSGNPTVRTTTRTMETKSNFDLVLSSIRQDVGSNLTKLTEKLVNVPITPGNNLSTFIFITNYDDQDQSTTYRNIQELKKSGSVNFIILGNIIKTEDLEPLQPSNIFYWNFDESNSFFKENDPLYSSLSCLFEVEENFCQNGDPLQNCDTDIILSIDASTDALPSLLFQKEISLIRDNITLDWTNFNKVALTWYNEKPFITYKFGQINSKSQFDNFLNTIQQSSGSKLSLLLNELNNIPTTLGNKLSTFIFISSSTNEEVNNAIQYADQLKQKGTLNFIILGNIISETDLKPLNASNIFYWTFADYCIEPLINFFINSLDCKQQCSNATTPNSLIITTTTIPPITMLPTTGSSLSTITKTYTISPTSIQASTISPTIGSSLSTITEISTISPTSIQASTISPTIGSSLSTITEISTISPTSIQPSTISSTIGSTLSTTNEVSTVSTYSTYSSSSIMPITTESTSTVTITIPSIPPKCNNSVYFVIDHRQNITNNEFYDQVSKIQDITSNWDISINQASIDVNSFNEVKIFLTFSQQPKSDVTLLTNTTQWNCILAYLGQNANDCQKYCNSSLLPIMPIEEQDHTMDQFLHNFYNVYLNELEIKVEIPKPPNEFSLILFSKTGNQTEIDNCSQIFRNINSKSITINPVFVKLPNSFNGNYGNITNYDFSDPDLGEKISDSICS